MDRTYKLIDNKDVRIKMADRLINYNIVGAVSALLSFIGAFSADWSQSDVINNGGALTLVILMTYFTYVLIVIGVIKLIRWLREPNAIKIEDGKVSVVSVFNKVYMETDEIKVIHPDGKVKEILLERFNINDPYILEITPGKGIVVSESEVSKLK